MKWKKIISGIITCAMVISSAVSSFPMLATAAQNDVGGGDLTYEKAFRVSKDIYIKGWHQNLDDAYGTKNVLAVRNEHAGEADIASYGNVGEGILKDSPGVGSGGDPAMSFLQFDLSELRRQTEQFQTAKLRLYMAGFRTWDHNNAENSLKVSVVPASSGITELENADTYNSIKAKWTNQENFFTYEDTQKSESYNLSAHSGTNNAAEYESDLNHEIAGTVVEVDLTQAITGALADSGEDKLILAINETQNKEHYFVSLEGSRNLTRAEESMAPSLVLTYPVKSISAPDFTFTAPAEGEYPMPAKVVSDTHHEAAEVVNDYAASNPLNLVKTAESGEIQSEKQGNIWGFNAQLKAETANNKLNVFGSDPIVIAFKIFIKSLPTGVNGPDHKAIIEKGDNQYALQLRQNGFEWYSDPSWTTVLYEGFTAQNESEWKNQWHNVIAVIDKHGKERLFVDNGVSNMANVSPTQHENDVFSIGCKLNNERVFSSDYGFLSDVKFYSGKTGDGEPESLLKTINLAELDSLEDKGLGVVSNLLETVEPAAIYTLTPYNSKTVWKKGTEALAASDKFQCGTEYTAVTTLTAHNGYVFATDENSIQAIQSQIAGANSIDTSNVSVVSDGAEMTVTVTFPALDCAETISISDIIFSNENIGNMVLIKQGTQQITPKSVILSGGSDLSSHPALGVVQYEYSVTEGNCVTVNSSGLITASAAGTATVRVTASLGSQSFDKDIPVSVAENWSAPPSKITYAKPQAEAYPAPAIIEMNNDRAKIQQKISDFSSVPVGIERKDTLEIPEIGLKESVPYFNDRFGSTSSSDKFNVSGSEPLIFSFKLYLEELPGEGEHTIISKGSQYVLALVGNSIHMYMNSAIGENKWPQAEYNLTEEFLNKWHEIIMVVDGKSKISSIGFSVDQSAFILNGRQAQAELKSTDKPFAIGYKEDSTGKVNVLENGYISDIKFYDGAQMSDDMKAQIDLENLNTSANDNASLVLTNLLNSIEPTANITVNPFQANTVWNVLGEDGEKTPLASGAKFTADEIGQKGYAAVTTFQANGEFLFDEAAKTAVENQIETGETDETKVQKNVELSDDGKTMTVTVTYLPEVTEPENVTVTFEANGGELSGDSSQEVAHGGKAAKPSDPTREGYRFIHWYLSTDTGEAEYNFDTAVTENITLKAKWIKRWNVTFHVNQAGVSVSNKTFDEGENYTLPTPSKSGVTFAGWYEAEAFTGTPCTEITSIGKDWNLYAKWTATVTFKKNDGTDAEVDTQTITCGGNASAPAAPSRDHYTFGGWYLTEDCAGNAFSFETEVISAHTVLYAKWTPEQHTVTFQAGEGAVCDTPSVEVNYNETIKKLPVPTKANFVFVGWFTDESYTTPFTTSTHITANMTVYAKWEDASNTWTVTFMNGTTQLAVQHIVKGEKIASPPDPTGEHDQLVGWYREASFTTLFNISTETVTEDLTLYAKLEPKKYKVTFNWNDKETDPTISEKEFTYNTLAEEPSDVIKTGYTLTGWYKLPSCSEESKFDFATEKVIKSITLYAKWELNEYKVTLHRNYTAEDTEILEIQVKHDSNVVIPADAAITVRDGYTLTGWHKDQACTDANAFDLNAEKVTSALDLYAKWTKNQTPVEKTELTAPRIAYVEPEVDSFANPAAVLAKDENSVHHDEIRDWSRNPAELVSKRAESGKDYTGANAPYIKFVDGRWALNDSLMASGNDGANAKFNVRTEDDGPFVMSFKLYMNEFQTDYNIDLALVNKGDYQYASNVINNTYGSGLNLYSNPTGGSTGADWKTAYHKINPYPVEEWRDVIAVFDGNGKTRLYVGGHVVTEPAGDEDKVNDKIAGGLSKRSEKFAIGCMEGKNDRYFTYENGYLADVKLYSGADMTAAQKTGIDLDQLDTQYGEEHGYAYLTNLLDSLTPMANFTGMPYDVKTVWSADGANLSAGDKFEADTAYTATTTFVAHEGFIFPDTQSFKNTVKENISTGSDAAGIVKNVEVSSDKMQMTVTVTYPVKSDVPVTGVKLDKKTISLTAKGEQETLTATVEPEGADQSVTWSSSNEEVATVENGTVTAVGHGTATITATSAADPTKTETATVTVTITGTGTDTTIPVEDITLDKEEILFKAIGEQEVLIPQITPRNATNREITWKSSDTGVAVVKGGRVTAVGEGTAEITVQSLDNKDAKKTVTVKVELEVPPVVEKVTLSLNANGGSVSKTSVEFTKGETVKETDVPTPARTGYHFTGWYQGQEKYRFGEPLTQDVTLTAKWSAKQYTAKFVANGGSPAPADQTIYYDGYVPVPKAMQKTGYKFNNWYSDPNFKNVFSFKTEKVKKDVILYAKWDKLEEEQSDPLAGIKEDSQNGITYTFDNIAQRTVVISKADSKKVKKVKIPKTVKINGVECKVVGIKKGAFKNCKSLKNVTIGSNVKYIEANAFQNCRKLKNVKIEGKALKTIKKGAFKGTPKGIKVTAKGYSKKQKRNLLKKLKNSGMKNPKIK